MKLAHALLRRKELQDKLDRMKTIDQRSLFEVKVERKNVTENVDDIIAKVPKISYAEFSQERDFYAKQLREIDGYIQQANWNTDVPAPDSLTQDFKVGDSKS